MSEVRGSTAHGDVSGSDYSGAAVTDLNTKNESESSGSSTDVSFNEQTNYVPRRRIVMIFLTCASVDMVALIDQTTLAVALSIIGSALHAGRQASWIANAYFLTSTSFQLIYGRLSDIWSRKLVLLSGLFIFFFGSLAASLAQTAPQLIAFRAITGVGGGGLMTVAQIIVSDVVSLRERGKYQGILGAVVALSNGVGPVIGGALVSQSEESWRWIFRLNLPLTLITTACVFFFMPLRPVEGSWKKKLKAVDFIGAALTLACSALLVLGFTWAGADYAWDSAHVLGTLIGGVATGVLFILHQWKLSPLPLMPLYIFRQKVVVGAVLTMFVNGWNFVVQVYYIPSFYQLAFGYSPIKAGTLLLPLVLVQTASSTLSGLMVTWTGRYKELILFGWVLWAVGLGLFSTINENTSLGKQVGYSMLTGFGIGHTLQPSLVAIQAGVARADMAVVTSTRNFVRNLGGTLGLAIAGTLLNNHLVDALQPLGLSSSEIVVIIDSPLSRLDGTPHDDRLRMAVLDGYRHGFRIIFILGAALAALATLLAFWLLPNIPLDRNDDEEQKTIAKLRIEEEKMRRKEKEGDGSTGTSAV
ncbi:MFS drug transporter [Ascodesmis nigricans]|uniref:MFS drug transporter n=1 Tax=Ascodesmis nigricans TaxID=341454 RepID=A0A4S2MVR1_9PEZI|nr:MFS drug transporter [Ascodesmis nigricans]